MAEIIQAIQLKPGYGEQTLQLPKGCKVLSCGMIGNIPIIWIQSLPNSKSTYRKIVLLPTGQPFTSWKLRFIGTAQVIVQKEEESGLLITTDNPRQNRKVRSEMHVVHFFDAGENSGTAQKELQANGVPAASTGQILPREALATALETPLPSQEEMKAIVDEADKIHKEMLERLPIPDPEDDAG